jgi:hypothetical protein
MQIKIITVAALLLVTPMLHPSLGDMKKETWKNFKQWFQDRGLPTECREADIRDLREQLASTPEDTRIQELRRIIILGDSTKNRRAIALACSVGKKINQPVKDHTFRATFASDYLLHNSLEKNNIPVTRVLLGLSPNLKEIKAHTKDHPVCWAQTEEQFDLIMSHMPENIDSVTCGQYFQPLFRKIVSHSSYELLKHIVEAYKPNLNQTDEEGRTILHSLALNQRFMSPEEFSERWELLIDTGASPYIPDNYGKTADDFRKSTKHRIYR